MKEVADRAGVAVSSVSRVLNGHPAVSEELRQRVLTAVTEVDYELNYTAKSLRSGATMTVAFLVRDIASPLFAEMVKAAERHLRRFGYSLLLTNSGGDPVRDAEHIRLFARRRVDGLIVTLSSETHRGTQEALQAMRAPVVLIDRHIPDLAASAVLSDHRSGVRDAVRHLADQHRRIGFIAGTQAVLATRERFQGYKDGLRAAGIRLQHDLVRMGSYDSEFGHEETVRLLALDEPPTALITGGVTLTYGALEAVQSAALRVPEDLTIVSCDSFRAMNTSGRRLGVVDRDAALIGTTASELLLEAMTTGTHQQVTLPTEFVTGEENRSAPVKRRT
jgi:LacI family transcriptional regulator